MLSQQGYLELLNDKNYKLPEYIDKWQQIFYGMSLHIDGVCPYYMCLREPGLAWIPNNLYKVYPSRFCGIAYQYLFETSLLSRHPREPEQTRQWRYSQYRPFTQAPFLQVIQVITGAIFQDSGYQVTVEDKDDNDYIWGNSFEGKNLIQFIADKFQNMAEDPNGLLVVIPAEPYYNTTTSRIEPKIHFVHSRDIKYLPKTKDEIVFRVDDIYWAINKGGYFRFIEKDGKVIPHPDDEPYEGYYAHMMDRLPVIIAGGQWNTQGFYDSWLNAAKPIADEFVSSKSAEQLVNKEASHPFIVAASDDCPECTGGLIRYCTGCNHDADACSCSYDGQNQNWTTRSCNNCGGSGEVSRNPGQWMIVPIEDMDKDAIKIINPSVDINKFHAENNKELYNAIMRALHLDYIEEAQSGVAKDKDMETRYQFLLRIANDLFDRLIPEIIYFITSLRNVTTQNGRVKPVDSNVLIVKPTQFQIKTEQDLLDQYKTATESNLPSFIKAEQLKDTMDKLYGGNPLLLKITSIIFQLDSGALKSDGDWSIILLNGAAEQRDYQFHQVLPGILYQIVREKGQEWFLGAEFDSIKAEVDKIFTKIKPPVLPVHDTLVRDNINT